MGNKARVVTFSSEQESTAQFLAIVRRAAFMIVREIERQELQTA